MGRRRYHGRAHFRSRDIGLERARQHIEDARRLTEELGGTDQDVKKYFFSLLPQQLRPILNAYEQKYGPDARDYADKTIEKWRTGKVHMSGTVAERLFNLLPPRMPLASKYELVENLWNHVGPKSKKTLRVGLDAGIEQVLDAVRKHIDDVVVHYKISEGLEKRFNWLAAGDAHVKQDLLNHLQQVVVCRGAPRVVAACRGLSGRVESWQRMTHLKLLRLVFDTRV